MERTKTGRKDWDLSDAGGRERRTSAVPGKRTRVSERYGAAGSRASRPAGGDSETVQERARAGVEHASETMPHASRIQAAFGKHDIFGIRARVGGPAAEASESIGAKAYAIGDRVAFGEAPDLHTAAHEAAHVVQQRAGVSVAGGVGSEGDEYERHADRVADMVVGGQSAEAALSETCGGAAGADPAVQRLPAEEPEQDAAEHEATIVDAGYTFARPGQDFECVKGPPADPELGVGNRVREVSDKDGEAKTREEAGWRALDQKWREAFPDWQLEPEPGEPGRDTGDDSDGGWTLPNPLEWLADRLEDIREAASSTWEWLWGGEKEGEEDKEPEVCDPDKAPEPIIGTDGKPIRDNLDVAIELSESVDVGYKQYQAGGDANLERARQGNIDPDAWKDAEINCGQFTLLTLAAAGWNVDDLYRDEGGRPVAYLQTARGEDGSAEITFVQHWMLINAQPEAMVAVMNAQIGGRGADNPDADSDAAERWTAIEVAIGGDEDNKLTVSSQHRIGADTGQTVEKPAGGTYWVDDKKDATFIGRTPGEGLLDEDGNPVTQELFGVAAAVISMGGESVDSADRKPGDLQQRLNLGGGTFNGAGHSSTIYEVVGTGICYFDPRGNGTPVIAEGVAPTTAGWYRIEPGAGKWRLGPDTSACHVATFVASDFKLVDANEAGDGGREEDDAIAIGADRNIAGKEASNAYSIGRLPTSEWFSWQPEPSREATPLPAATE